MLRVLVLLSMIVGALSGCDNACSGHGTCGEHGLCTCYDNWGLGLAHYAGDCSERICPFEFAWVDTPDKSGRHHKYAECSAKGICNRNTGDCECFPGYEGKGCQRTSCPNGCSGHGQCKYIDELTYGATQYDINTAGPLVERDYNDQSAVGFNYYLWDSGKTRACVCDPQYADADCSKRMCPYGTDIMDQRDDLVAPSKYHTQNIIFTVDNPSATHGILDDKDQTFALTFKSKLNETYTTQPINLALTVDSNGDPNNLSRFVGYVTKALQSLPNNVIDKVEVHASYRLAYTSSLTPDSYIVTNNALGANPALALGAASRTATEVQLNITFVGDYVQGPQNLLTVEAYPCRDGCTPRITGLSLLPSTQIVSQVVTSDFNSYECGRRGKCDYTTGLCTCFAGYTGVACGTITALV